MSHFHVTKIIIMLTEVFCDEKYSRFFRIICKHVVVAAARRRAGSDVQGAGRELHRAQRAALPQEVRRGAAQRARPRPQAHPAPSLRGHP